MRRKATTFNWFPPHFGHFLYRGRWYSSRGLRPLARGLQTRTPLGPGFVSGELQSTDRTSSRSEGPAALSMSVLLETSVGDLVIDLEIEACPKTCENFLKLCKVYYYNLHAFFNGAWARLPVYSNKLLSRQYQKTSWLKQGILPQAELAASQYGHC